MDSSSDPKFLSKACGFLALYSPHILSFKLGDYLLVTSDNFEVLREVSEKNMILFAIGEW